MPSGCKNTYENDEYWSRFTHIIEVGIEEESYSHTIIADSIKIYQNGKSLSIHGTKLGDTITIYNINGTLVHNQIAGGDIFHINLNRKGIYIVEINKKTFKIAL